MPDLSKLTNPVWDRSDNLRDPSVYFDGEAYHIFYSRYSNGDWSKPENWAIGHVVTKDFVTYSGDRDISPKGFASPGDLILWNGHYVLPYQSYPEVPTMLCYSVSDDLKNWSDPVYFLEEARHLPWNKAERVIDPTFVVDGKRLHCFFVGTDRTSYRYVSNLVGHAWTEDPELREWTITTVDSPLIGVNDDTVDGAENVTVARDGNRWVMLYSEGLVNQHLAYTTSTDLLHWAPGIRVEIPAADWMSVKYGAPFVWKEGDTFFMILMGENADHHTTFGLFQSKDMIHW